MLPGEEYLISSMMFQGAPFPTNFPKMQFFGMPKLIVLLYILSSLWQLVIGVTEITVQ